MRITPEACRAARALLNWSMRDLADHAGVSLGVVARLEGGEAQPRGRTLSQILSAFDQEGVEVVTDDQRTGAILMQARRKLQGGDDVAGS